MTSPAESDFSGGRKEGEPRPKVQVVFIGIDHSGLNLQGLDPLVAGIHERSLFSAGRKIIFLEVANFGPSEASLHNKLSRDQGLAKSRVLLKLSDEFDREPMSFEVEERMQVIDASDLDTIVGKKMLEEDEISRHFFLREVENQPEKYEAVWEQHSVDALKGITYFISRGKNCHRQISMEWNNGSLNAAIKFDKDTHQAFTTVALMRQREIVEQLKQLIKGLLKERDGGVIFIPFGQSHAPMLDDLQQRLRSKLPIGFAKNLLIPVSSPTFQIAMATRNNEIISDEVYAREILHDEVLFFLKDHAQKIRNLDNFGRNFTTIIGHIIRFANSFSLEEIRRICEERQDIGELLRTHPLTESLRPYVA